MKFIVHGASGAQGSPVVSALRAAGHRPVAAVRHPSTFTGPAVAVDLSSIDSLVDAYDGVDGVFVHLPLATPADQMAYARTIGSALRAASPARVVFSTSGYRVGMSSESDSAAQAMVAELDRSGVSYAVVEPRVFLDNLLLPVTMAPVRELGHLQYPIRDDYAISWGSHLDVADVVTRLLTDNSVTGVVSVGALPALVGDELAAEFALYLGRDVQFDPISPDDYGSLIGPMFGMEATVPVVDSYRHRLTEPGEVIDTVHSAQELLQMSPRTVAQWLRDVGA